MGRKLATLASKMGPRHIWRAESQGARKWRCHLMATNLRAQVPALAALLLSLDSAMGRKLATLASKMGPGHIWRAESQGADKWRCHLMATNLRAQVPALAALLRIWVMAQFGFNRDSAVTVHPPHPLPFPSLSVSVTPVESALPRHAASLSCHLFL